eukprot:GHVS01001938.1.p1 GENE.GHVS01001938.1~~GHVS01001938.1.p1  ORF type:complete len:180 (+),score=10.86 GHVS01001938.1:333-872(+)
MAMASIVKGIASAVKGIKVARMINSALVQSLENVTANLDLGLQVVGILKHVTSESETKKHALKCTELAAEWGETHSTDVETVQQFLKKGVEAVANRKGRYYPFDHFEKLAVKIERALEILRNMNRFPLVEVNGIFKEAIAYLKENKFAYIGGLVYLLEWIIEAARDKVNKAALVLTADP